MLAELETYPEYLETGYQPHPFQELIHEKMQFYRFTLLVCHRRFGKTTAAIHALHDAASRHEANPEHPGRYCYAAPHLKQAKNVAWSVLKSIVRRLPGVRINESELYVEYPNGARITLFGCAQGQAEGMRGLWINGIVMDEPADIPGNVWPEIIRPATADVKGWSLWIGTPKGVNSFYERYERALQDPDWLVMVFRADETNLPWLDDDELEKLRRELSENQYRQELLCDFSASADNVIIPIDLVVDASQRAVTDARHLEGLPKVLAVDVARFGGDRSVIIKRHGHLLYKPETHVGLDNMELVGRVAQTAQQFQPDAIFVDGGRGEGVIDRLRQLNFDVIEVNFGAKATNAHYANKRTEMMFDFRDWLEAGGVIPNDTSLMAELSMTSYKFNSMNQAIAQSKDSLIEELGKSPDVADAAILTVAYPVIPKSARQSKFRKQSAQSQKRYNPRDVLKRR